MKRKLIIISILMGFLGCSSLEEGRIAGGYIEAYKSISNAIFGYEDNISKQLVKNIPYASMTLQIGNGPKGLLVLESIQGDELTWVSFDRIYVITKNGRIVRTSGLETNLTDYRTSFNFKTQKKEYALKYINYYSFDSPTLFDLRVQSTFIFRKSRKVTLINGSRLLNLVEETVINDYLGWKKVNKFWLDDDNHVWKTEQFISPNLPIFKLEITKKPS